MHERRVVNAVDKAGRRRRFSAAQGDEQSAMKDGKG